MNRQREKEQKEKKKLRYIAVTIEHLECTHVRWRKNRKKVSRDKTIHMKSKRQCMREKSDAFVHLVTLRILQIYGTIYQSDLAIVVSWSES